MLSDVSTPRSSSETPIAPHTNVAIQDTTKPITTAPIPPPITRNEVETTPCGRIGRAVCFFLVGARPSSFLWLGSSGEGIRVSSMRLISPRSRTTSARTDGSFAWMACIWCFVVLVLLLRCRALSSPSRLSSLRCASLSRLDNSKRSWRSWSVLSVAVVWSVVVLIASAICSSGFAMASPPLRSMASNVPQYSQVAVATPSDTGVAAPHEGHLSGFVFVTAFLFLPPLV